MKRLISYVCPAISSKFLALVTFIHGVCMKNFLIFFLAVSTCLASTPNDREGNEYWLCFDKNYKQSDKAVSSADIKDALYLELEEILVMVYI